MAYELKINYNDLMNVYSQNHKVGNKSDIKRAYEYACNKHAGVVRGTGEPYINHPLRVAKLLADWGFESGPIIAALLHDVVEDCDTSLDEIEEMFGSIVANTVDAVTALSDKDFADHTPTKEQLDILSDAKLQKKMNENALYVKIADRIDNLSTLSGVKEEKRIPKAEHTREIIIPLAKAEKAYYLVDILEELCFETEHPEMYKDILKKCRELRNENSNKCHECLDILSSTFDPKFNRECSELDIYHDYILDFTHRHRSRISIFRQIVQDANNIMEDWQSLLCKYNVALYDLTLIVKNELGIINSDLHQPFRQHASCQGIND